MTQAKSENFLRTVRYPVILLQHHPHQPDVVDDVKILLNLKNQQMCPTHLLVYFDVIGSSERFRETFWSPREANFKVLLTKRAIEMSKRSRKNLAIQRVY